ncbi:MAG: DUF309 domain-containing protein [Bacteroidales bacterium]
MLDGNSYRTERYTSLELPTYAYIPGKGQPENVRPGKGHLPDFSNSHDLLNNSNWKNSEAWLYAIDLFNHGYFWEVHEILEHLWTKIGRNNETGLFLQGIILVSVALVKLKQNNLKGYNYLMQKATLKLKIQNDTTMGLDVNDLLNSVKSGVPRIKLAM